MIDYVNYDLFTTRDSIKNSLTLTFSNGDVITEDSISDESFELTESLCSEQQLTFGCCESSELKITLLGTFLPHDGQMVTVTSVLNDDTENPFTWGTYYVFSDVLTADRTKRELTCYDIMYDILKKDMSEWYNTIAFPTNSTVRTIKWLRDSFMSYLNITQVLTTLVNDNITITKTISPSQISGKEIIRCICEANGVFGHITRDNKFAYINLKQIILGLYPANDLYPDNDLYPSDEIGVTTIGDDYFYYDCTYESYEVHTIDKLIIRQDDGDIGRIVGTGTNAYIIQGNFLFYGKNNNELLDIANNIYDIISYIKYRPFDCELKGNPCIEVGDGVRIRTTYDVIYSYVLKRTLKGIYALRDTLISDGPELRQEQNNSVNAKFEQLRSKTLKIEQSVDKVSTELTEQLDDTVQGSYAYQTAQEIGLKVSKSNIVSDLDNAMSSGIVITPSNISFNSSGALLINTNNVTMTEDTFSFKGEMTGGSISGTSFTSNGPYGSTVIDAGRITTDQIISTGGGSSMELISTELKFTAGGYTTRLNAGGLELPGCPRLRSIKAVKSVEGNVRVDIDIGGYTYQLPTTDWVRTYHSTH